MDLWALTDLCTPWCVHVVVTLRIANHLAAGKTKIEELAAAANADPDALDRVLRHLVSKGVFEQTGRGCFALNDTARSLLDDSSRLGLDLHGLGGRMAHAWGTLLAAVQSGKPAYHQVFGSGFWDDLDAHPNISADLDELMGPSGHGTPDPEVLVHPADWGSIRTVVDVGGGTGAQLAEILRARPHLHGTLVDLPRTIARSTGIFRTAGVEDRVSLIGQSFFDPLPAGADLYLLKSVLSDWPDREATAILQRCAEAARPSGRVVALIGAGPGEEASPDLLMLVLMGGRNRNFEEFGAIARQAGLEVRAWGRQPSGRFLVECRPA